MSKPPSIALESDAISCFGRVGVAIEDGVMVVALDTPAGVLAFDAATARRFAEMLTKAADFVDGSKQ